MPSIRFRLDKPTLTGLAEQVRRDYGPDARIVATQESVVGGLGGLFGRKVVDVTVDLPDAAHLDGSHEFDMPTRVGLAALLQDADSQDFGASAGDPFEDVLRPAASGGREPAVSTQGHDFASMLDALRIDVEPAGSAGGGTPARPLPVAGVAAAELGDRAGRAAADPEAGNGSAHRAPACSPLAPSRARAGCRIRRTPRSRSRSCGPRPGRARGPAAPRPAPRRPSAPAPATSCCSSASATTPCASRTRCATGCSAATCATAARSRATPAAASTTAAGRSPPARTACAASSP